MSNKARRMLFLLLIILKEAGPTAACSSSCSSECNCSSRGLTSVPQDLPTSITRLSLEDNAITNLTDTFAGLNNLWYLSLHSNQLTSLPADIFAGLADIFAGLDNLQRLWLSHNQLQTLSPVLYDILGSIDVRSDHPFDTVRIDNNPWQCDCKMAPFRQRMNGSYPFESQITCAGPANLAGQLLRDVSHENLICEETTPVHSTNTHHVVDSTLNLSYVSSSPTFHQSAKPTSKAPTLPPTSGNTAGSNKGLSTVSTSPWSDHSTKSTPNLPTPHTASKKSKATTLFPTPIKTPTTPSPLSNASAKSTSEVPASSEVPHTVPTAGSNPDLPTISPENGAHPQAREGPQSHKYVNSQVIEEAAKDAAAGLNAIVYEDYYESVDSQSQTAVAPGADSPNHYETLRNPSGQQQHTYTSLLPRNLQQH
ncbi:uncharacterized protein LOC118431679 [Branchiostoma floridae]|uniref:Uncharacterized protein LOC118431679 n=1 Tax=Branchiostoma floridae TaxID=7739 RepID=A0A9J7MCQ6_BRAFL|nr:uncharacterized protein LOC118431679 [Branchiostoma floridae]